jgi:uncharacterized protein (DUF849 family)
VGTDGAGELARLRLQETRSPTSSTLLTTLSAQDTRFDFECYDTGHLYTLRPLPGSGAGEATAVHPERLRILGGIGTHAEDVMHMRRTADRLFGSQYSGRCSEQGAARCPSRPCRLRWWACARRPRGLALEGPRPARHQSRSGRLVRQIVEGLGLTPATPDEAREILHLKGRRPGQHLS